LATRLLIVKTHSRRQRGDAFFYWRRNQHRRLQSDSSLLQQFTMEAGMATIKIDKPQWHHYFDQMSKTLVGKSAEIEVDALDIGSQIEAEWVPLLGVVYDMRSDILSVAVEGLDHMIRHPQSIFVEVSKNNLASIEVIDGDQFVHIVKLRDPLLLAASA
jgi:hypothetical protein